MRAGRRPRLPGEKRHPPVPHQLGRGPLRVEPRERARLDARLRAAFGRARAQGAAPWHPAEHAPRPVHRVELARCRRSGAGEARPGVPRGVPQRARDGRERKDRAARGRRVRRQAARARTVRQRVRDAAPRGAPTARHRERRPAVHRPGRAGAQPCNRGAHGVRHAASRAEPRARRAGLAGAAGRGGRHLEARGRRAEDALRAASPWSQAGQPHRHHRACAFSRVPPIARRASGRQRLRHARHHAGGEGQEPLGHQMHPLHQRARPLQPARTRMGALQVRRARTRPDSLPRPASAAQGQAHVAGRAVLRDSGTRAGRAGGTGVVPQRRAARVGLRGAARHRARARGVRAPS